MAPPIPDRWKDYKPVGEKIEGTRFIAFKVPLKEHIARNVENDIRLDNNILMKTVPNLGLIIDLTNTNRYYDPEIFQKEGVEHKKLMIPGHKTPPKYLVDKFIKIVKEFMENNPDNDKLIGVHCTHGVNRTGYLICNYMISQMTIEPNEALDRFAKARGHKIERNNYIDDLKKRNNEHSRGNEHSRRDSMIANEKQLERKCSNEHLRKEYSRDQSVRTTRSQDNYRSNIINHNNESTTRSSYPPPYFANNRRNYCYSYRRPTDDPRSNDKPPLPQNEEHFRNSIHMTYPRDPPRLRVDYYNARTFNRPPRNNHNIPTLPQNEEQLIIPNHQQPARLRLRLDYYNARPVKDKQRNHRRM